MAEAPHKAVDLFKVATNSVSAAGFDWESSWQRDITNRPFSESDFLRETAWVILCSGFRETAVRSMFDYVSLCFCDWESSNAIADAGDRCVETALSRFRHEPKLRAILRTAVIIQAAGYDAFRTSVVDDPQSTLMRLPFIGPVTWAHVAKNLGLDLAKNDRHLARLAESCGYRDAQSLCEIIAERTGELVGVVDVILWRFATLKGRVPLAN